MSHKFFKIEEDEQKKLIHFRICRFQEIHTILKLMSGTWLIQFPLSFVHSFFLNAQKSTQSTVTNEGSLKRTPPKMKWGYLKWKKKFWYFMSQFLCYWTFSFFFNFYKQLMVSPFLKKKLFMFFLWFSGIRKPGGCKTSAFRCTPGVLHPPFGVLVIEKCFSHA